MGHSGRMDGDRKLGTGTSRRRRTAVLLLVVVSALLSACSGPSSIGPKPASDRRPLPNVTSVLPNSGPTTGGTNVTITGSAFTGTTKVSFGSVAASSFHVVSGNEVTAISPPQSTSIQTVSVTTPEGTSAPEPTNDQFTYDAPTPVVTSVAPASGPDAGGTLVTITGSGFIGTGKVRFGTAVAARFTVVSDTVVTAVTPAQLPGPHPVYVTTAGGTNIAGAALSEFRALAPVAVTTAVTPASGPTTGGTTVTITGTGFSGATRVAFGAVAATSFTVVSNTEITAVTPVQPAGVRPVLVTTTLGGTNAALGPPDSFSYIAPIPSVASVSPQSGPVSGGTTVTITGTGFTGTTKVAFGAVAAVSFAVVSDTEITAVTPAQPAGTRVVHVTTAGGVTSPSAGPSDEFTYGS